MFVHHQLWFQQHQHDFTGCGDFAQKLPTSQRDGLESQKNLNTWTINSTINLLQVFYGHLCSATIKILLTASLNLLNLFFLSTFEQIIPWGNSTAPFFFFFFFCCQESAAANPDTQDPPLRSLPVVSAHQSSHLMMMMSWPQTDSATI